MININCDTGIAITLRLIVGIGRGGGAIDDKRPQLFAGAQSQKAW